MPKTSSKTTVEWKTIPWQKLERKVFKLQKRIYKASIRGDLKAVRRLQKTLMKSWSAKCIAVRRVTQDNCGKKTAGVDGIKSLSPKCRLALVNTLKLNDKASPTRRVWIPKPGSEEKRGLGIPTISDRARQALVKLALEPEWEARFEPNSFGFRPGRSCHDAIGQIFSAIKQKAKYVLDADISKCFDRINHQALLEKLNTFPTMKRQIKAWLKAGVMDSKQLLPTLEGTPQAGVISPLLANIALHGLENQIAESFPVTEPKVNGKRVKIRTPDFIRYADDFVVLHEDIIIIQKCKQVIVEWLDGMGLELKPNKTRISHTLDKYENNVGFDFLGFHVRQYPVGNYRSSHGTTGKPLGFTTIITPSSEKLQRHIKKIGSIIDAHKSAPQAALIGHLNPVIRGWANYYATVSSKRSFSKADYIVYQQLRAWAKFRHSEQNAHKTNQKYWHTVGKDNWCFSTMDDKNLLKLRKHTEQAIVYHIKVQGGRSPFDGDWAYWGSRLGKHPELTTRVATLLKKQKGKCTNCGHYFKDEDVWEVDHILPRSQGGKDTLTNLQLLHRYCHDTKTANDCSHGNKDGCNITAPKPSKD
ncbi:group II intron reverse transcriptase/maturase [Brasilonema sp. UFV-L1]|nr:group II intron reverse transcriptase/maturase [Brasilonema sp. UFV-L1]